MSNTINPYGTSRPELQRSVQPSELEEDGQRPDQTGAIARTDDSNDANQPGKAGPLKLEGLTPDEQQLIYRYFPESPSLDLRLYKPDMSPDKVDPGSLGSRVDLRG